MQQYLRVADCLDAGQLERHRFSGPATIKLVDAPHR
jgi:hypothetical protein